MLIPTAYRKMLFYNLISIIFTCRSLPKKLLREMVGDKMILKTGLKNKQVNRMRTAITAAASLLFSITAFAQTFQNPATFAVINSNGGGNQYYDLQATTGNPDFNNYQLGNFVTANTLVFAGGENNISKCTGEDVTANDIWYNVHPVCQAAGSFTQVSLNYNSESANGCGGRFQKWDKTTNAANLLSGLLPGSYVIEVYSTATTAVPSTLYASNGGSNYKAYFTYNFGLVLDPSGDGGFETGNTLALNNWTTANSAINAWVVGTTPSGYTGSRCAYISNNGGAA